MNPESVQKTLRDIADWLSNPPMDVDRDTLESIQEYSDYINCHVEVLLEALDEGEVTCGDT